MTAFRRFAHSFALIGFVALLNGCTGDQSISSNATFNADLESNSGGDAIILVGLRVMSEPTEHGLFNISQREVHPVYTVQIRQMSADGQFARFSRRVNICEATRGLFNGALSDCTPDQVRYKILSVPPGRYTVEFIAYQTGQARIITNFNTQAASGFFDIPGSVGHPVRDPGRSFAVYSGSITYIGDLTFYFDPASAAARMALGRNDAAAQSALSSYPNVHGTPVFRPATGSARLGAVPGALMP